MPGLVLWNMHARQAQPNDGRLGGLFPEFVVCWLLCLVGAVQQEAEF